MRVIKSGFDYWFDMASLVFLLVAVSATPILLGVVLFGGQETSAEKCAAAYTINGITQMDGAEASKELLELVDKCNKKFSEGDL